MGDSLPMAFMLTTLHDGSVTMAARIQEAFRKQGAGEGSLPLRRAWPRFRNRLEGGWRTGTLGARMRFHDVSTHRLTEQVGLLTRDQALFAGPDLLAVLVA